MCVSLDQTVVASAFARDELIESCFGDPAFAESLLETFQRDAEAHLEHIRRYAAQGELAAAIKAAHALQGSAAIATAKAVQRVAAKIEASSGPVAALRLQELVDELGREIGHCRAFLAGVRIDAAAPLSPHTEQEK